MVGRGNWRSNPVVDPPPDNCDDAVEIVVTVLFANRPLGAASAEVADVAADSAAGLCSRRRSRNPAVGKLVPPLAD